MTFVASFVVGIVALIHAFLGMVEIFAWTTRAKKFLTDLPPDTFEPSEILAKNVGVYNCFLAAGLVWSLIGDQPWKTDIAYFFLFFISVAGIFGSVTADRKLFLVQTVPAVAGIIAIYFEISL